MSHNVQEVAQLTLGYAMGLGEIREECIELVGERLSDIQMPWQPATLSNAAHTHFLHSPIAEQFGNIRRTRRAKSLHKRS
jgi:hypothetical protein